MPGKSELADRIAARGWSKAAASSAVDAVLDEITAALVAGERVTLTGFGTFESAARAARTARNPQTGVSIDVPATTVARFHPGATLRTRVASGAMAPLVAVPNAPVGSLAPATPAAPPKAAAPTRAPAGKSSTAESPKVAVAAPAKSAKAKGEKKSAKPATAKPAATKTSKKSAKSASKPAAKAAASAGKKKADAKRGSKNSKKKK